MPNNEIADLIADRLATGLPHPGGNGDKPLLIPLPGFKTTGMPPELAQRVQQTAKLIAEGIVHLIETAGGATIINKTRLAELEATVTDPGYPTAVVCRDCQQPLFWANALNGQLVVSKNVLSAVNPECPHGN